MQQKKHTKVSFSSRVSSLAKNRGIRQNELAAMCGVSTAAVNKWFKGGKVKAEYAAILSKYFGVTTEYLLGLDSETMLQACVKAGEEAGDNDHSFNLRVSHAQAETAADRYFLEKDRADRLEKQLAQVKGTLAKLLKALGGV
jgi:transcriptional regulator with XRE-family HTH domain